MNFEEKMKKLETIVMDLEKDEIKLEESITKYTEAMELIKDCDKELKEAEIKIAKIVNKNGDLEDFGQ